jgi:hypothetical protein
VPRNRPSSLRRAHRIETAEPPPAVVPHLSRRAARQLAFAEVDAGFAPGGVVELLRVWDRGTRGPDLRSVPACPCPGCDLVGARRDLALSLQELPRRERALVGAALSRADRRYAARTSPDPLSREPWWFERRFQEQDGWGVR